MTKTIEVNVFTGFLGAGKTTIILSLLKQLEHLDNYKICLLKNEFGDIAVDSQLAKENNVGVLEYLNGCICCVLVGQLKLGLLELKEKYNPDRIIIETSGSAFPAPIAWQIREMKDDGFHLDSIVTVIDCVNFTGYEDTSYTAKMQAKYTDAIILNKHELVDERQLDIVIDRVNDLNTDTPKIKCNESDGISPDLIFGLDTRLFEICTKSSNPLPDLLGDRDHHANEIDLIQVISHSPSAREEEENDLLTRAELEDFLRNLPSEDIYRVKGYIRVRDEGVQIVNHAFGRPNLIPLTMPLEEEKAGSLRIKITVMGQSLALWIEKIKQSLRVGTSEVYYQASHRH
ncbi:uncharacterized protein VTP21DRAFT_9868 [Calcarisporiella thermophila]|uniref:uncharacterized protein n=1 Tax=Calcarisporiella thermophila TaxID=911321 RepID=UPI003744310D